MPGEKSAGRARVLVVATSRRTRGGITSVVRAHERGAQWAAYGCRWIETHCDRSQWVKLCYFLRALVLYVALLPRAELVHIHLSERGSALRKLPFFLLARWGRKKTVVHFHAFSPSTTIRGPWAGLYRFLFARATRVVVLSPMWARAVEEAFGRRAHVRVIYNPCVSEAMEGHYPRRPQILYAGTVCARKGYAELIRAFASVAPRHEGWTLALAGNGETREAQALADALGIGHRVRLLGWVDGRAKDRVFKESALFCLPSHAEGFPMGVLDAWAYALPVLTTPVGGIPDIAVDRRHAILFPPGDVEALARALDRAMGDEALRRALAAEGHQLATTVFAPATVNAQVGALYAELIGEPRMERRRSAAPVK